MKEYQVKLPVFEGPLDVLLELIKKNELDIYQVSLADITDQYLAYIEKIKPHINLAVAGDFLVIAATLIYIKSQRLLPTPISAEELTELEESESAEVMEEQLRERLIEYQKYKELANQLKERENSRSQLFTRDNRSFWIEANEEPYFKVDLTDLILAYQRVAEFVEKRNPAPLLIEPEKVALESKINDVRTVINEKKSLPFSLLLAILQLKEKIELAVVFFALLELARTKEIWLIQTQLFGEIFISKREKIKRKVAKI